MRLLLDEMFSPLVARGLRDLDHDVLAVGEAADLRGIDDPGLMRLAREQHRAIVTNNISDFVALHNWAIGPGGEGHSGLVLVSSRQRRRRQDTGALLAALGELMLANPEEESLADSIRWLGAHEG